MSPSTKRSSPPERTWTLELVSEDPTAELSVFDQALALQERPGRELPYSLRAGLYRVSTRTPGGTREAHLVLGEESRLIGTPAGVRLGQSKRFVTVNFESASLASPIPLAGTTRARDYHRQAAQSLNKDPPAKSFGAGGEILVFSRGWSDDERSCSGWHPLGGMSLCDAEGRLIVDLEAESHHSPRRDPYAGLKIAVRPGAYRLCHTTKRGQREICLHVPLGWQLHVYLLTTQAGVASDPSATSHSLGDRPLQADLAHMALLLSRSAVDLEDQERTWLLTEQARYALSERQATLDWARLPEMLSRARKSPLLCVYIAHLLLLVGGPDERTLVRAIVRRLRAVLGQHPDVDAISLGCGLGLSEATTFRNPPTLRRGWTYAVLATAHRPSLIPLRSQAAPVAAFLQGGGPWLVSAKNAQRSFLDTAEQDLLGYWYASYRTGWALREGDTDERTDPEEVGRLAVIEDLGLPYSVLMAATTKLCLEVQQNPDSLGESPSEKFAAWAIQKMAPARLPERVPDEQLMLRLRDTRDDVVLEALFDRHRELVLQVIQVFVPEERAASALAHVTFEHARKEAIPTGPMKAFVWLRGLAALLAVKYLSTRRGEVFTFFLAQLTERKQEVWKLREAKLAHHEIADRLGISERTVQRHEAQTFRSLREYLYKLAKLAERTSK